MVIVDFEGRVVEGSFNPSSDTKTHADHSTRPVSRTAYLSPEEVRGDYELETGNLIIATMEARAFEPTEATAVLVAGHGPFTWGASEVKAIHAAAAYYGQK